MTKHKFILNISKLKMAEMVAGLLNTGGQLSRKYTSYDILTNNTTYYIEIKKDKVIGVIGIEKKNESVSEIKHTCVHYDYRNSGIGTILLQKVIESSETKLVYGLIRQNNYPSIHNALKLGFKPIAQCRGITNKLIIFGKKRKGGIKYDEFSECRS